MSAVKNILVPTDFSEASEAALKYACRLADALDASICVLHAVEDPYPGYAYTEYYVPPREFFEAREQEARKRLEAVLTEDERAKYKASLVLRNGPAAREILQYLNEPTDVDLVVMATHGRGGVARLMMGSVADKVVRAAPRPVLTIRVERDGVRTPRAGVNRAVCQLADGASVASCRPLCF